jgi:hypothetical protein
VFHAQIWRAEPMSREKRAKLYFRLMDVTLFLALVGFADWMLDLLFGIVLVPENSPYFVPMAVFFGIVNFLVPALLLIARFMRDEYAEQLWQRTVIILVYILATVPALMLIAVMVDRLTGVTPGPSWFTAPFFVEQPVFKTVMFGWMTCMLLFVGIFQFLRWRDAR